MSEEKWYDKEFFTDDRKEKSKKAGKVSAFGGIGLILFAFFLGYCFMSSGASIAVRIEAGFAFAVYVFLGFAAGFCGLFVGVYWIFNLDIWFAKAIELSGFTGLALDSRLIWWGFYPAAFIGCLINFIIIVAIGFFLLRWILRKIRK